ncbi:MAG: GntR family transcriptional regulator, partial [Pseudomonadota bacterium]
KTRIFENTLEPGRFVLQETLAAELGVSRTPVREALIRLEREGLVEIRPRRGMRVLPVSRHDMTEIYEVLAVLEAEAARLAAERAPPEMIDALQSAADDMDSAIAVSDRLAWAEADDRFHKLLADASGNARLKRMVAIVTDQAARVRRRTLHLRPLPRVSASDHLKLVRAIRKGDGDRAFALHEAHRRKSARLLMALLEHLPETTET